MSGALMNGKKSQITDRVITLLGQGITGEQVAAACGITSSAVSQLASDPELAKEIAELRFKNLAQFNERDDKYNQLEDTLLEQLKGSVMFMGTDPMKIARILMMVNKSERRGQQAPTHMTQQNTVVQLTLPVQIINQFSQTAFTKDVNNQVIKAGNQELVTVQSADMTKLLEAQNVKPVPSATESIGVSSS